MAHGRYSYIAIGKEATKGVKASNIETFLKHSSGVFDIESETIESKALVGRLLKYDTAIGTRHWAGKIDGVEIDATSSGLLFKSFFGSETVQGTNAPYSHVFKLIHADDYVSLTFEQYKVEWLRFFLGGRVTGLTFKGELNSIMSMDVEVITTNFEEGNPANKKSVTLPAAASFRFYETVLKMNGTPVPIKSFEISLKENAEADYNFLGGKFPTQILRGGVEVSFSFELNLSEIALDFWRKMINEEDFALSVEMVKSQNERLLLSIPRARFTTYSENSGDEVLTSDVEGIGLSASNDIESVTITLVNSRESEY